MTEQMKIIKREMRIKEKLFQKISKGLQRSYFEENFDEYLREVLRNTISFTWEKCKKLNLENKNKQNGNKN